jgi:predicted anti-sigma-YlaC factor YlaD
MDETMLKFSNEPPDHVSTELMSLALDGLLESGEQQEFDAHLQVCEACRGQWHRQ